MKPKKQNIKFTACNLPCCRAYANGGVCGRNRHRKGDPACGQRNRRKYRRRTGRQHLFWYLSAEQRRKRRLQYRPDQMAGAGKCRWTVVPAFRPKSGCISVSYGVGKRYMEKSTMRSWLNGYSAEQNTGGSSGIDYTSDNFIGAAFSEKEQGAIADTTVVNDDNPTHGTEGGNDTTDKIFLLSIAEATTAATLPMTAAVSRPIPPM